MNAPARIPPPSQADMIAFAEALARAHVARDLAAAGTMKDSDGAHRNLRPLQQR